MTQMGTTYRVGGAVRDKLLGYPYSDHDWVVVGSTPDRMLADGFQPVGKDFPVFLHPQTKEEYALARTERKTAPGYSGFVFHTDANITLEQDLIRRDLTINAIAEDSEGNLIDPFNGLLDIQSKILRHVSAAFAEDPVRILRVARFAARYRHLGFTVAAETNALMRQMVEQGEANHLIAERVWKETEKALGEKHPEAFFKTLRDCGALAVIFPEIEALFGVEQRAEHHPEVDSGIHTMMSLIQSAKLSPAIDVRFATLVHDLGKAITPKELLPRHTGHEHRGTPLIKQLCLRLAIPKQHRDLALKVAEDHLNCHRAQELTPPKLLALLHRLDAFRNPDILEKFILCCKADARGRTNFENIPYPQQDYLTEALAICNSVQAKDIAASGLSGKDIGDELKKQRHKALKNWHQELNKNEFEKQETNS
jgi:tRNA nucleotidyltransferase (CCA-adding enzyme)